MDSIESSLEDDPEGFDLSGYNSAILNRREWWVLLVNRKLQSLKFFTKLNIL